MAELHAHSSASDGVPTPEALVDIAQELGLDVLAITDHDTTAGALRARRYAERSGATVEIVVGMEVTTLRQDHIVGLFLEAPVAIFRSVPRTVEAIHAQGGLAVVAHPFLGMPSSISPARLRSALQAVSFDGIEIENQYMRDASRRRVRDFVREHGKAIGTGLGGSDAHFGDLAKAVTLFRGKSAQELRAAIEDGSAIAARGTLTHARPGMRAHAQNQFRSLVKLPIMRARVLLAQAGGRPRAGTL